MSILPKLFSLPVIVVAAWVGANIYQDNELFANPFVKQSILDKMEHGTTDKIEDGLEEAAGKAKQSFKKGVEGISESIKEAADEL